MGFIRHAVIGIALYEAAKYLLNKNTSGLAHLTNGAPQPPADRQTIADDNTDVISAERQALYPATTAEPETDDPWRSSLANDELRAPDS